jgi:hypothetical protein
MLARSVFDQNNGDVTKAYYATMNQKGYRGMLAVALFRAQKRSTAAKKYKGRGYRQDAYEVKNWSLTEICKVLRNWEGSGMTWGWGRDLHTPGFTWVLYVDLPTGQCSFHCADRAADGPDYTGKWRPGAGSESNILEYCDSVWDPAYVAKPEDERALEEAKSGRLSARVIAATQDEPQSHDAAGQQASHYPMF